MAKVIGPCLSLDAAGTIGKLGTFQKRLSGHSLYLRNFPGGREPFSPSPAQNVQRAAFKVVAQQWATLDSNYKDQWDDLAKEIGEVGTGFHLYCKLKGVNPTMVNVLDFDGINDYVNLGTDFLGTTALTIEGWFNVRTVGGAGSGRILDNGELAFMAVTVGGNMFYFYSAIVTAAKTAVGAWVAGEWVHVAVSRTANNPALTNFYINGVLSGAANQSSGNPTNGIVNLYMGDRTTGGRAFDGWIAQFRVWNLVLAQADIAIHSKKYTDISFTNTAGCSASNLIAHYKMLEGLGSSLIDSSGKGKTGAFKAAGEPAWKKQTLFKDLYGLT